MRGDRQRLFSNHAERLLDALPGQSSIRLIGFQIGQVPTRSPLKRPDKGAPRTLEPMQLQQLNGFTIWLLPPSP